MDKEKPENPKKLPLTDPSRTKLRDYGKYSSMAFQMGITIALGVWGGMKLDESFPLGKFPIFTIVLSLLGVFGAMYWVIKDLLKK
jgi:hypothetical protein